MGAVALVITLCLATAPVTAVESPVERNLVLVGVVLRETGRSFAIIEDSAASRVGFYPVGATVGSGRLTRIQADRVTIVLDGAPTVLRLGTPVGSFEMLLSSGAGANRPSPAQGTRRRGPGLPAGNTAAVEVPRLYGQIVPIIGRRAPAQTGLGMPAGGATASMDAGSATSLMAGLEFTGLHHDGTSKTTTLFSSGSLRDLLIGMNYANLSGSHQQRIELYAPDGSLYQKISGGAAASTQTRIPVGGTWITGHSLQGNWLVKVYLDSATDPVASGTFVLTP